MGKNLGKKNATTPEQQAALEAQSQHEKKLKKGYVTSLSAAQAGEVNSVIEGGIVPMTALVYSDRADKVIFPVAVQPKLDGHRCVAVVDVRSWRDGDAGVTRVDVSLWTRTRKRIRSVPHLEEQLGDVVKRWLDSSDYTAEEGVCTPAEEEARLYSVGFVTTGSQQYRLVTDGECYNHDYRDKFEELTSLLRHDGPAAGHEVVEYHVYDVVSSLPFLDRFRKLEHLFDATRSLRLVETHVAHDEQQLLAHYEHFRLAGYEGAMCRTLSSPYEHKRSSSLLKMKDFVDAEARIVGVEEGRGKLQGHVGAFVCEMPDGKQFNCKLAGETAKLKEAFEHQDEWVGRRLRYKYQGLTADGKPRFPTGLHRVDEVGS